MSTIQPNLRVAEEEEIGLLKKEGGRKYEPRE